jgi:proline racemase
MLPMREPVDAAHARHTRRARSVEARCRDGQGRSACSSPTSRVFVTDLDVPVEVEGLGRLTVDVAYGGAFFASWNAPALGLSVEPKHARELVVLGNRILAAVARTVVRRVIPRIPTSMGVTSRSSRCRSTARARVSRNAVVVAPGRLDRSPCGTGTCARLAVLHARGAGAPARASRTSPSSARASRGRSRRRPPSAGGRRSCPPSRAAWITGVVPARSRSLRTPSRPASLQDLWGT